MHLSLHPHAQPHTHAHHHAHARCAPLPEQRRRRIAGGLVAALALYLATGFYAVQPNERALVRRCGRMLPNLRLPGLHLGLPLGIDRVTRLRPQELKRVGVGGGLAERAVGRGNPLLAECLTGDRNLLNASAVVQYRIADPRAYLFSAADVPALVECAASAALAAAVAGRRVDDILTVRRLAIQEEVRRHAQATLDRYGVGVQLTAITLEEVAPPADVAAAFREVAAAREDRQRAVNEALGYANRLLPRARGEADQLVMHARGAANETVQRAGGEADRFRNMAGQLATNRTLTTTRLRLETAEVVLPRLNKIVLDPNARPGLDLGIMEGQ